MIYSGYVSYVIHAFPYFHKSYPVCEPRIATNPNKRHAEYSERKYGYKYFFIVYL